MSLTARVLQAFLRPTISSRPLADVILAMVEAMDAAGLPVDRASWSVPLLHPDVRAVQMIWRRGQGVEPIERNWDGNDAAPPQNPIRALLAGEAESIRARLGPGLGPHPWPILDEFTLQGFTDYLVLLEPSPDPFERAAVSWATRSEGGWTEEQAQALVDLLPMITTFLRLEGQRRRGQGLLSTYLGVDAATRVLEGRIRRGDLVDIDAAISFCDLRGFTAASSALSSAELVALLDEVFDAVVGAIEAEGGDVLKFIGDAVLAVFRGAPAEAAVRALRAAEGAGARLNITNVRRRASGRAPLEVGFGLHVGRASYGNVGGAHRLDFTVIGRDVNVASRVEGLCSRLGARLVATEAFVLALGEAAPPDLEDAGDQTLKGVPAPVRVFMRR